MSKPYQVLPPTAPVPAPDDVLERLVREGARKMLQDALDRIAHSPLLNKLHTFPYSDG